MDIDLMSRVVDPLYNLGAETVVKGRTLVQGSSSMYRAHIGVSVPPSDRSPEDREYRRSRQDPPPEYFDTVVVDTWMDFDVRIAADEPPAGKTFIAHCRIGEDTHIKSGTTMAHVETGWNVRIGHGVQMRGTAEEPVVLGTAVIIEDGAVLEAGVNIGAGATINKRTTVAAGARVPGDYHWGTPGVVLVSPKTVRLGDVPGMTQAAWVLERLAGIADENRRGRISKQGIRVGRPDLMNLAVTKEVLRAQPPLTGDQLREMAEESTTSYRKYEVFLTEKGWGGQTDVDEQGGKPTRHAVMGGQVLASDGDNDVLTFGLTEAAVTMFAEEEDPDDEEEVALRRALLEELMREGKTDWHPGGTDLFSIGWARVVMYPEHRAMMVEEIQTDLNVVTRARDFLGMKTNYGLPSSHLVTRRANAILGKRVFFARPEDRKWSTDPVITDDDMRAIAFEVATFVSDFYETAMAYLLMWAREKDFESVYYPDYRTKEFLAEFPPKSIYDRLPKRFQTAPVVDPPPWLKWTWADAAGTGERPPGPRFRKMRPNNA